MSSYIFDRERIRHLISDFYTATGVATVLYDAGGSVVAKSPVYTPYCRTLREGGAAPACDRSDAVEIEKARRTGEVVRYTCHAGMCELIRPVYYEGIPIAFLQIGQFRLAGRPTEGEGRALAAAAQYGCQAGEVLPLYRAVPEVGEERLRALENMMTLLVKALWADGLIARSRSMLSVKVEQYVEAHLAEGPGVPELCRVFSLTKNALYRLFRTEFGTTVTQYVSTRRLLAAAELLRASAASVTEVAAAVGYDDYNYFIRLFKKEYGVTPLAYRKREKQKQNTEFA